MWFVLLSSPLQRGKLASERKSDVANRKQTLRDPGEIEILLCCPKKVVLFTIGNWNAKVGSQEIPGITGKFGLGIWNEAGQGLTEFCQENA